MSLKFLFFKNYLFIFILLLVALVAAQAFSSCGEWGDSLVVVHELLIAVVSLVAEHRL